MQCAKYNEWKSSTMYMKSKPCIQQTRNNWLTCRRYAKKYNSTTNTNVIEQTQTKKQRRKKKLETWIWKKSKLQAPFPTPT